MKRILQALLIMMIGLFSCSSAVSAAAVDEPDWTGNRAKISPNLYNRLLDDAGLASYIYTDRTIDMKLAEKLFRNVETKSGNYIIGKDSRHGYGLLITRDGLIVSYLPRGTGLNETFTELLPQDEVLKEAVKVLIGPEADTFNHLNFQYPEAANTHIFDSNGDVTIPLDVRIHELAGYSSRLVSGSEKAQEFNPKVLQPGETHKVVYPGRGLERNYLYVDDIKAFPERISGASYLAMTYSGSPIEVKDAKTANIHLKLKDKFDFEFTDVHKGDDHYEAIRALTIDGAIKGYSDGTFRPDNHLRRDHVAVLLANVKDLKTPPNVNTVLKPYSDVDSNTPYAEQIAAVTKANIFKGSDGKFMPERNITREQMATVLVTGLGLDRHVNDNHVKIYLDDVDDSHKSRVQVLADLGITNQLDGFRPTEPVTRGQFATMLYKSMEVLSK